MEGKGWWRGGRLTEGEERGEERPKGAERGEVKGDCEREECERWKD